MVRLSASIGHIGLLAVFIGGAAAQALASELVAPGAKVELLAGGFTFTEGPACDAEGNVYFTDIPNERIHKWSVDGKLTTFRENSGKANGLYFDREGNLLACEGGNRRLTSISPGGKVTVLADSFQGKKLNSPNDLWVDPKGASTLAILATGRRRDWSRTAFTSITCRRIARSWSASSAIWSSPTECSAPPTARPFTWPTRAAARRTPTASSPTDRWPIAC